MDFTRIVLHSVVILVGFKSSVFGSMNLAQFSWIQEIGAASCEPAPVEFYLAHAIDPSLNHVALGQGLKYWDDESSGSFDFTPQNSFGFDEFAMLLSDGSDDYLLLLTGIQGCLTGTGNGNNESAWLQIAPDLLGNEIEYVRLIAENIEVTPSSDGISWRADLTYQFWGTPVPEPASLIILALPLALSRRLRCRHYCQ